MAPIFDEAIDKVFQKWTLLALAVEEGWGGRNSRAKRDKLQADVMAHLAAGSRKRRPPTHENEGDIDELARLIFARLDEFFNTEADDNSPWEVASLCLRLFSTCRQGDVSFAQQFLAALPSAPADLSRCTGVDVTEYATEEDRLMDQMQGMDLVEGDGGSGSGSEGMSDDDMQDGAAGAGEGADAAAGEPRPALVPVAEGPPKRAPPPEPVVDE
eukprot:CAMPEP_0168432868 /NCGR_PEP_ID=MMETSP0228-20121227/39106_1 /TAXON_ID=133427 /ORGANISM="Protoceratium reticulatum, Strain CCCM 535 (=CCMP 1889)" /LENGTH=213 /DNA_ID=CAMNT_0008446995 /DNA_START=1 /DNA_END=639 /DNA_ORIENTATION=+